jgi:hypothetical protein
MRRLVAVLCALAFIGAVWSGRANGVATRANGTPAATPELGAAIVDHFGCISLSETGAATPGAGTDQRLWIQKTIIPPGASLDGKIELTAKWTADVLIAVDAPDAPDGTSAVTLMFDAGGTVYFWNEGRCEDQTDIGCKEQCESFEMTAGTVSLDRDDSVFIDRTVAYNIFNESGEDAVLWVAVITDDEANCPPCPSWP